MLDGLKKTTHKFRAKIRHSALLYVKSTKVRSQQRPFLAVLRGMGHQYNFFKIHHQHSLQHGGELRKKRSGRKQRSLSTRDPLHVVFKINKLAIKSGSLRSPKNFIMVMYLVKTYALRFSVKVEQVSIQFDHIHLLIRAPRRSKFHSFFRVLSGQIAQVFQIRDYLKNVTDTPKGRGMLAGKLKLWKHRPFSRVVKGFRAYGIVRDYIQLNEKEAMGVIKYQKRRLKGLSSTDWELLWK